VTLPALARRAGPLADLVGVVHLEATVMEANGRRLGERQHVMVAIASHTAEGDYIFGTIGKSHPERLGHEPDACGTSGENTRTWPNRSGRTSP